MQIEMPLKHKAVLVGSAKTLNEDGQMFVSLWTEVNGDFIKKEYGPYPDDFSSSEEDRMGNEDKLFSTTLKLPRGHSMDISEDSFGDLKWCIYHGELPEVDSPVGLMEWRRESDEFVIDLHDFIGMTWLIDSIMEYFPQLH